MRVQQQPQQILAQERQQPVDWLATQERSQLFGADGAVSQRLDPTQLPSPATAVPSPEALSPTAQVLSVSEPAAEAALLVADPGASAEASEPVWFLVPRDSEAAFDCLRQTFINGTEHVERKVYSQYGVWPLDELKLVACRVLARQTRCSFCRPSLALHPMSPAVALIVNIDVQVKMASSTIFFGALATRTSADAHRQCEVLHV